MGRSLDGVRVISVVDREADFFALFAEQRATLEVELLVNWYALRWRVEDYFRVLKTGCRVQQLQHQRAERLKRAIAMHAVIAWRILLMTLLGREEPELPAQWLFSDLEIRVLEAFAASRGYPPPTG